MRGNGIRFNAGTGDKQAFGELTNTDLILRALECPGNSDIKIPWYAQCDGVN